MQEQIVGFEVAKLAKDKGFKELCLNYYFEDGELRENKIVTTNGYYGEEVTFEYEELIENWNDKFLTKKDGSRCFGCPKARGYFETFSAPQQSVLQRWLREVHNVHIEIYFNYKKYYAAIFGKNEAKDVEFEYETYEKALEGGLFKAFELI